MAEAASLAARNAKIAELANKRPGNLTGYDCPECLNRGWFLRFSEDGYRYTEECKCMEIRRNYQRLQNSGLENLINRYNFDTWQTPAKWQEKLAALAKRYAESPVGWFVVSGEPGSGKTHICTAICKTLMEKGLPARYMLWRTTVQRARLLKDDEESERLVNPLKTVRVLYIDDFLKVGKGSAPSQFEANFAFDLLNARYNDDSLYTIISSELTVNDFLALDEATGSRIYERSKGRYIELTNVGNWRMRG